ncbi:hypothetical protein [Burkholderia cenocepacia]|uniref:hypothetical protein n=2 Tax=Burkholderia cenocepacia TaxID=95486 RepID=UPI0013E0BE5C|nr:hypothetical protein [Burkholderia cenocepacia]MCW3585147.1 hypothetical protein [Burkholderia cenocepacia]MCW3630469.1 hypothetical protein [Burkholderia cenocepacia]MCW5178753.1 hypothetical protein [Burkholderia cenocepacia]NGO96590.1 hypothetical protein [Burkholderia cenocepacia]
MATQKRLQKEDIERARQVLLAAIYSELPDDRFIKKQAVRQLLSTLIAARDSGMPFERIADVLKTAGLEISSETLRSYFFELKTQEELAAEAQRHAKKVLQTKSALERRALEQHVEHAASIAVDHVRRVQASPRLVNAFSTGSEPSASSSSPAEAKTMSSRQASVTKLTGARPASPAAPILPLAAESARVDSEKGGGSGSEGAAFSALPTSESQSAPVASNGEEGALTLAAIEQVSLATEERAVLEEDVELRGDLVFYVSGKPFQGSLTKKQIHLLKTVGRIIAPTKGKSSKDFVAMPPKL